MNQRWLEEMEKRRINVQEIAEDDRAIAEHVQNALESDRIASSIEVLKEKALHDIMLLVGEELGPITSLENMHPITQVQGVENRLHIFDHEEHDAILNEAMGVYASYAIRAVLNLKGKAATGVVGRDIRKRFQMSAEYAKALAEKYSYPLKGEAKQ